MSEKTYWDHRASDDVARFLDPVFRSSDAARCEHVGPDGLRCEAFRAVVYSFDNRRARLGVTCELHQTRTCTHWKWVEAYLRQVQTPVGEAQ